MWTVGTIWTFIVVGFSFSMLLASLFLIFKRSNVRGRLLEFVLVSMEIIRWAGIVHALITMITMLIYKSDYAFINRATGPYAWGYWMMFIGVTVLPQLYWLKACRKAPWRWIIAIALLFTSGRFFEEWILVVTSFHRDYGGPSYDPMMLLGWLFTNIERLGAFVLLVMALMLIKKKNKK